MPVVVHVRSRSFRRVLIAAGVATAALAVVLGTYRPAAAQEAGTGTPPAATPATAPARAPAARRAAPAGGPAAGEEVKPPVQRGIPAVWMMDADGSNPRPLVKMKGMRWHGSPSWSQDGNWVAFDATPAGYPRAEVYVYAVGGPQKGTLKNLGPGNCPTFSRDDKLIAFNLKPQNAAAGEAGVYLMKLDGSDRRRLCDGDHPKWSPDGTRLLVSHEAAEPGMIDEVVLDTGKVTRLLTTKYGQVPGAVYSPDGSTMAFVGYDNRQLSRAKADLVVADLPALRAAAASARLRAAAAGEDAAAPAPAPAPAPADVPEGAVRILQSGRLGWIPNWSPDGKRLVYVTWEKSGGTEYDFTHTIDVDGKSPPVRLKGQEDQGTRTGEAEWSPDGKAFVFHSDREFPAEKLVDRPDPPASGL